MRDYIYVLYLFLISMLCGLLIIEKSVNTELRLENQRLNTDINITANTYLAMMEYLGTVNEEIQLRQDLTSLIVDAARTYGIEPMMLAKVIKSESNFRPNPNHGLPQVKGSAGINTNAHKQLKNNASSYTGNIYSAAEILAKYVEDSDSLTLAIARYKGLSPLGLSQAKSVVKEYEMYWTNRECEKKQ